MLQAATAEYHEYYHLISGVDLPLKTQDEIHKFFDEHAGSEFVTRTDRRSIIKSRLKRFRFFQEYIGRNKGKRYKILRIIEKASLIVQRVLLINRLDPRIDYRIGTNWFSITHDLAIYVLSQKAFVKKQFRYTQCGDEVFMATLVEMSPYRTMCTNTCCRYIDWERGSPYIFTNADFELLCASDELFARKFDERVDMQIILRIYDQIMSRSLQ